MVIFKWRKVTPLHKYSLDEIWTSFNRIFVLDAKMQNSTLWNISNVDFCCNSVAPNINFKTERVFSNRVMLNYAMQRATSSHNPPQPPTTSHNEPQPPTANYNETQLPTTSHNEPQRTTTNHNHPQRATTNYSHPQRATTNYSHLQRATTTYSNHPENCLV